MARTRNPQPIEPPTPPAQPEPLPEIETPPPAARPAPRRRAAAPVIIDEPPAAVLDETEETSDPVSDLLDSLAGKPAAIVEVYKMNTLNGREERIGGFPVESFDLDAIHARYKAGTYRIRARVGGKMIGGARVVHLADPFTLPTRDAAPAPIAQPSDPLAELARAVREIRETLARPAPALGLGEIMPLLSAIITRPPEIGLKDVLALMAKNDTRGSVSELIGAVKEIRELAALEAPAAGGDSLGQIVGAFAPMFAAGIQQQQAQQQAQQQQQAARPALAAAPRPITQQPAPQAAGTAPAVQQPAPAAGGGVLESLADLAPLLAKAARHNAEPATYADVIADALEAEGTFEQAADQLRQLAPGNLAAALAATVPALEQAGPWLVHVEAALRELIDQPAAAADEPAPAQEAQQ